jgi:hypothetical protein
VNREWSRFLSSRENGGITKFSRKGNSQDDSGCATRKAERGWRSRERRAVSHVLHIAEHRPPRGGTDAGEAPGPLYDDSYAQPSNIRRFSHVCSSIAPATLSVCLFVSTFREFRQDNPPSAFCCDMCCQFPPQRPSPTIPGEEWGHFPRQSRPPTSFRARNRVNSYLTTTPVRLSDPNAVNSHLAVHPLPLCGPTAVNSHLTTNRLSSRVSGGAVLRRGLTNRDGVFGQLERGS